MISIQASLSSLAFSFNLGIVVFMNASRASLAKFLRKLLRPI